MFTIIDIDLGYELAGDFNFNTIKQAELKLKKYLQNSEKVVNIYLSKINSYDSSLLALLMVVKNITVNSDREVNFHGAPVQLVAMAELSGLADCLALK